MSDQANSFGRAVDVYDAARPGYPAAAVDWLLEGGPRRVLDLGAGTGKFTASLVDRGLDVVAVEPDEGMLARLHANLPAVQTAVGSAERIPLPDASVDAVFAAQAWHWVDAAAAVPEVARVLRPGGSLGLIWNVQDSSSQPWVAALAEITGGRPSAGFRDVAVAGAPFGPMETATFRWILQIGRERLHGLVDSWSDIITGTEERRRDIHAAIDELLDTHPELRGRAEYPLTYVTHAFRARLAP